MSAYSRDVGGAGAHTCASEAFADGHGLLGGLACSLAEGSGHRSQDVASRIYLCHVSILSNKEAENVYPRMSTGAATAAETE